MEDLINAVVGVVAANPKTAGVVALVPVVQFSAPLLARIPALWGKGQQEGAGSGWYKFWHKVAAFPVKLPGAK